MANMKGRAGSHHTNLRRTAIRNSVQTHTHTNGAKYSLQGVHAETLVHAGAVGEECSQRGLEDQTKVERPIAHSLVHDRVTAGLADDQVSPLHHHDRHEEGGVARELETLAVPVRLTGVKEENRG